MLKMVEPTLASKRLPVIAVVVMLLVVGCAGIRPAVEPPEEESPAPEQTAAADERAAQGVREEPREQGEGEGSAEEAERPASAPEVEVAEVRADSIITREVTPEERGEPKKLIRGPVVQADSTLAFIDSPSEFLPPNATTIYAADLESVTTPEAPEMKRPDPESWRIQVATVAEERKAEEIVADLTARKSDRVQLDWRGGRYTVFVGEYPTREAAQVERDRLRAWGYGSAFVVRGAGEDIVKEEAAGRGEEEEAEPQPVDVRIVSGWRVQVISVSDKHGAHRIAEEVMKRSGMMAYVEEVAGAYKVRVGDYTSRREANEAKTRLRELGYSGAFPVQTDIMLRRDASNQEE